MIKLMRGDCLDRMSKIPDGSVDMVLADPPYGTTACKWDSVIPLEPMWEHLRRVTEASTAILLFGAEPFSSLLRVSNLATYRHDWYWVKNRPSGGLSAKVRPMQAVEIISVFYQKKPVYLPQMIPRTQQELKRLSYASVETSCTEVDGRRWNKSPNRNDHKQKYPTNSILGIDTVANRAKEKVAHPTQKPVALMEYLIKTYTNPGETVLDFTMSSGTTGVACKHLGRSFIGIELDKKYFAIAKDRIKSAELLPKTELTH